MTPLLTKSSSRFVLLHWLVNAFIASALFLTGGERQGVPAPNAPSSALPNGSVRDSGQPERRTGPDPSRDRLAGVHTVPASGLKAIFSARSCYHATSGLSDWFMKVLGISEEHRARLNKDIIALDFAHHGRNQPEPMPFKDTHGRPVFGLRLDPVSVQTLERDVAALLVAAGADVQSKWAAGLIAEQISHPGGPQSTAFTATRRENGISVQWFRIDGGEFIPARQWSQSAAGALHPIIARAVE